MLKGLTNTIKNACNDIELTLSEYIVIGGKTIPIKAELNDDCYDNGNFVGTFILKELKFEASNDISYRNKEFEYYKRINGESIKIGTFITTEINNSDSEEVTKVVAMDYGLKTQIEYKSNLDYGSGNITLLDVWNECCELSGLESGVTKFTNSDFIVTDDQFTGTGATIRDVFIGIGLSSGSFIKVMNDDKIYPIFNEYDSNIKSGNNITLENDINNNPIDIQIDGKSEQETRSGKNLLKSNLLPITKNGITISKNDNGDIVVNGTITGISSGFVSFDIGDVFTIEKGTYTSSVQNKRVGIGLNTTGFNGLLNITMADNVNFKTATATKTQTIKPQINIRYDAGTFNNYIFNPMLEKGSTATDYEEYTGGQPSPSPDYPSEIKTVKGIRNLFDKDNILVGKNLNYNNGDFDISSNRSSLDYTSIKENKNYIVGNASFRNICFYDSEKKYISYVNGLNQQKFTTPANAKYIRISFDNTQSYENIFLYEGTTPHDYVPYGSWLQVKNTGKNFLYLPDGTYTNNGVTAVIKDGVVTLNGTATETSFVSISFNYVLNQNVIYTLSANNSSTVNGENYIRLEDAKNRTYFLVKLSTVNASVSNKNDAIITRFVVRSVKGTSYNNFVIKPQLEKGTESTSYEPYQEQSILIDMNKYDNNDNIIGNYELCSIGDTKDELNIDKDGNVSITQNIGEVVLDGSESGWGKNYVSSGVPQFFISLPNCISGYKLISTHFININEGDKLYINKYKQLVIINPFNNDTLLAEWKTWLSTHPVTVKYILAKPQTISLGKITPLKLLEGTNNITTNDELQPNMMIEYSVINEIVEEYTELEDKRDTQPITCLRLGLSQIEGENVDIQDEDLIKKYGENWLIINDNPFAYTQAKRVELINAIFDKVKGFGYSAFVSKTSFKPYLTCGDVIKFRNKAGELVKSIVLRYNHDFDEITLEAPSETSATVNYVYPTKDIDLIKRTEIIVDKNTNQITSLTQQTTSIQDDLQQNYYDKTQTNQLIQTSSTGITNTFSEAGGNNIFRNTGLWFEDSSTSYYIYPKSDLYPSNKTFTNGQRAYEFWDGLVLKEYYDKAANLTSLLLQNGYFEQKQQVPNGNYTVSFKYKKLIESATTKVIINNVEYNLTKLQDTEFRTGEQDSDGNYITQPLEVTDGYIFVRFYTNVNNSTIIYDLMVNAGSVKLAYSQNQNETTTDTVNISKGITITSSNTDTTFKANSDGIRTLNKSNEVLSEFTDKGMKNKQIEVTDEATIVQVLWQNVGGQTWLTRL